MATIWVIIVHYPVVNTNYVVYIPLYSRIIAGCWYHRIQLASFTYVKYVLIHSQRKCHIPATSSKSKNMLVFPSALFEAQGSFNASLLILDANLKFGLPSTLKI